MGAKIYNSNLKKELIEGAGIQTSHDEVPSEIAEKVIPTLETNPKLLHSSDKILNSGSTGTMYECPPGKEFYITSAEIAGGGATSSASSLGFIYPDSTELKFLYLVTASVGVLNDINDVKNVAIDFSHPLKMTSGMVLNSDVDALEEAYFTVIGYEIDV